MTADEIASVLELSPHPDGGRHRETWREGGSSASFRLLAQGDALPWTRLTDAVEVWQLLDGAPVTLSLAPVEGGAMQTLTLSKDAGGGRRGQVGVPSGWWRSAASDGDWSLLTVTVSTGPDLPDFLAPG